MVSQPIRTQWLNYLTFALFQNFNTAIALRGLPETERGNEKKPVGVEALAGGPAATTFNGGADPYRLKPLLQPRLKPLLQPLSAKASTPTPTG